ncbi:MAG: alpha/beta fold hydrolase [candidate division Zixibacteria bacterium]|nr:alpha/beta fold hydrolase [candidate division Zixibacteria bacterium]
MLIFQNKLVYVPHREIEATPHEAGLEYEEVVLETEDNVKLSAWWVPSDSARGTLLFCHGNAGNISHRLETLLIFHNLKLNTFIFDYRGYGKSGGKPSERGTLLDAEAALRHVMEKRGVKLDEMVIFGRSLGGAIASYLAVKHKPKALIVESAFTSIQDIGSDYYPILPVRFVSRFNYPTLKHIRSIECPALVVHSPEDEIVGYKHGRRLYENAPEPKEFLEITGGHNDGFMISGERYIRGLDEFLGRYLDGE